MHFKYAGLMNITFITFLYGFGIPILFPVAGVAILVLYLVEKTMLYYAYMQPPMYDEKLSKFVLNKMLWAPVFFCAFGYWMATNKQLSSNHDLYPRAFKSDAEFNNHLLSFDLLVDAFTEAPAWPLYILFWVFLGYIWVGGPAKWCLRRSLRARADQFNEDIPPYFEALDPKDKAWTLAEEENANNVLGFQLLTKKQLEALKGAKTTTGRYLQGAHCYDILANPQYFDDFQYVPACVEDREKYIIDDDTDEDNDAMQSDLVRMALNLAFMKEDEAKNFKFGESRQVSGANLV